MTVRHGIFEDDQPSFRPRTIPSRQVLSLGFPLGTMATPSNHHHPLPETHQTKTMNIADIIAHLILLPVALFSWHHSRAISAAFIVSFVAASFYLAFPIDALRWFCTGLTGGIGIAVTSWRAWRRIGAARWNIRWSKAFGFSTHYPLTPDILASLLVGSSVADFISLRREAQGYPWGSLSFWQIAVSLLMIAICVLGKRTAQEEANRAAVRSSVSSVRAALESKTTSEL